MPFGFPTISSPCDLIGKITHVEAHFRWHSTVNGQLNYAKYAPFKNL